MSLAAALAADGVRPASFLPTIKCSDCGKEIEISDLETHICESNDAPPPPPPASSKPRNASLSNPFILRKFGANKQSQDIAPSPLQQNASSTSSHGHSSSKASRTNLPRINAEVANKPFLAPRQAPQPSPLSPAPSFRSGSANEPRPGVARSATSPAPRLYDPRPPSPELSANLDCAFPPFPTPPTPGRRPSAPSIGSGRNTPTGSDRAPSRGGSRLDQVQNANPEPFELKSPNTLGGQNVMKRMNTLKSGPFSRRTGSRNGSNELKGEPVVLEKSWTSAPVSEETSVRPSTSNSNRSEERRPSSPTAGFVDRQPPTRPERPTSEDVLSPTFLSQLNIDPMAAQPIALQGMEQLRPIDRSKTYPLENEAESFDSPQTSPKRLSRMRSEPAMRNKEHRTSLGEASVSEGNRIPDSMIPKRSDSKRRPRVDHRLDDAPPVPRAVEQYRHDSSHTPTDSTSSISSGTHSTPHTDRSGTSPSVSVSSSLDTFSTMNYETRSYGSGSEDNMSVPGLHIRNQQKPGMRAEQPMQRSPARNPRAGPPLETPPKLDEIAEAPLESPMDPTMNGLQQRAGATYEPWQASDPPARPDLSRTQTSPGPVPTEKAHRPPPLSIPKRQDSADYPLSQSAPAQANSRARAPSASGSQYSPYSATSSRPPVPDTLRVPPTPGSRTRSPANRPVCRGCNHIIEGKSVKASDGRLTGRWHKACFVCKSCQQPFLTADFYVINDQPYCEHHYHEENGSLCHGCHRGIEGQYLETSSTTRWGSVDKKFHPRCFTCVQCRTVLATDYFEIKGQVFCERHALATMRAQARMAPGAPGGLHPPMPTDRRGLMAERRTTRLINPIMA